jgi:DHA1 family bicyclomycin/chloramphenicol resistance-like MFS transporter
MVDDLTPQRRKLLALLIMISVALMVSSMDIFLPALPLMRDHFGTTEFFMQLALMLTPLTCALVGLPFGRLSDIYGRSLLLFTSFGFFLIGGLGCCFADTIEVFTFSRFVQAIGSGGISVLGVVVIADIFHGAQYARYMAMYGSLFPIVFAISPIIGAQVTEYFGWRSCFTLNFALMLVVGVILRMLLPETLKKGEQSNQGGFAELLLKSKMLMTDREYLLMCLGHALPITLTGLFIANASFIFIDGFAFSPVQYSFSQAIPIALNFVGAMIYRRYVGVLGLKGALKIGFYGFAGFIIAALGAVSHHLPNTPTVILAIFSIGNFALPFVVATCATRAIEIFPDDRGLSVSIMATLRNLFLGVVVSASGLFFNGTIFPVYVAMMMVCVGVLAILLFALQRPLVFAGE